MTADATSDTNEHGWYPVSSAEDVWVKVTKESDKGDEARLVEKGTAVLMDLQAWYLTDSDGDDYQSNPQAITSQSSRLFQAFEQWMVIVGVNDLVKGLDVGLTSGLKEGQTAYISCPPALALGNDGTRRYKDGVQVPAGSRVLYEVKPVYIVTDTSRLNPYFTIQKALARKKIANDLYQYECTTNARENKDARQRALALYKTVAGDMRDLLNGTYFASVEPNHPQRTECQQIMLDCYNNVVVLYMQVKEWEKALEAVDLALQRTTSFSTNAKALVRRAKICVYLSTSAAKFQRAKEAMEAAQNALGFNNKAEEDEVRKIKALLEKREQQIQKAAAQPSS